jgi:hypothetical protein
MSSDVISDVVSVGVTDTVTARTLPVRAGSVRSVTVRTLTNDLAILLAAAAGIAHLISTPTHWRWWQASGVFFAVLAVFQLGLAAALFLRRTGLPTLLTGIWGNVMVILVYVASRVTALPGQPDITAHHAPKAPGRSFLPAGPEGVGPFDMFSLVVELALVALLVSLLPAKWRQHTTSILMVCGLAMWGVAASGLFL